VRGLTWRCGRLPGSKSRASPCPACELDGDGGDDDGDDDDDDDDNDAYDGSNDGNDGDDDNYGNNGNYGNDNNNSEPSISVMMILHNCPTHLLPLPLSYESCHMKQYKHGRTEAVRCPCFTHA
jgi:hypothetical protein